MLGAVDATQAIGDLTEISPQVRHVAVIAADGTVTGSNQPDTARADRLASAARRLVEAAEELRPGVAQLEAATVVTLAGWLVTSAIAPVPTSMIGVRSRVVS